MGRNTMFKILAVATFVFINTSSFCQQTITEKTMNDSEAFDYPANTCQKAKDLMNEDFFWSSIEESGPFGNDGGADAFSFYEEWRPQHKTSNPAELVWKMIEESGWERLDWSLLDSAKLVSELNAGLLDARLDQDNIIIAIGFGQFVFEGRIHSEMQQMTRTAIERQLTPLWIKMWGPEYEGTRSLQLNKMLKVVNSMNE